MNSKRKYLGKCLGCPRHCFVCKSCEKIFDTWEEIKNK